ncbi:MAG: hypothetical protein CMM94_00035 [Rickettsiales bacterium]|nr:hypothetical protein [Rickettsiales bacterium]
MSTKQTDTIVAPAIASSGNGESVSADQLGQLSHGLDDDSHSPFGRDGQRALLDRKRDMHETLQYALDECFSGQWDSLGPMEHHQAINHAAHAILDEILPGNLALRVSPEEMFHLIDTIRDHAHMHAKQAQSRGESLCINSLKSALRNHPAVRSFQQKHDPLHGTPIDHRHHPDTGIPSRTVLAGSVIHNGMCESRHGHYTYMGHSHH